jgi:hypothetical protein
MRRDEAFVAHALVEFLGGPSSVTASDGDDPPDAYLTLGESRVGLEVTRLSQFTLESDGTLGNRATQDFFGLRLLDELNTAIGPLLPDDTSLLVGLWVPVSNAARFRKELKEWVREIAMAPAKGAQLERDIDGSKTSVSVIAERPTGKKIAGFVVNKNSSADIGLNARLVLEDRIRTKSKICAQLPKPVWLAVLNDYWLADADSYVQVYRELKLTHCFERIFLVADNGAVSELTTGA